MGKPDIKKLKSRMPLYSLLADLDSVFKSVLNKL
jgi:hypothetical protein